MRLLRPGNQAAVVGFDEPRQLNDPLAQGRALVGVLHAARRLVALDDPTLGYDIGVIRDGRLTVG